MPGSQGALTGRLLAKLPRFGTVAIGSSDSLRNHLGLDRARGTAESSAIGLCRKAGLSLFKKRTNTFDTILVSGYHFLRVALRLQLVAQRVVKSGGVQ